MPFLGPAIALWITLGVGVMAYYFLFIAHIRPDAPRAEWRDPEPEPEVAPRWTSQRWVAPAPTPLARTDLPVYDMEDFPTEKWSPSA